MTNGKALEGTWMPTLPLKMDCGEIIPTYCESIDSDNENIYKDWLRISEEEYKELKEKNVI